MLDAPEGAIEESVSSGCNLQWTILGSARRVQDEMTPLDELVLSSMTQTGPCRGGWMCRVNASIDKPS